MKIGLIGLHQTGKTTLFHLLVGHLPSQGGKGATAIGVGKVPDARIDALARIFQPKKTTFAQIELIDVAGFSLAQEGQKSGASRFLNEVRPCDALVHVVRAFENPEVIHDQLEVDPARDLEQVETELLFADLELVEKRIERIKSGKKITKENQEELELLQRCYAWLETGAGIRDMSMKEEERSLLKSFGFLTDKPRLAVINLDEAQYRSKEYPCKEEVMKLCEALNVPLIELCALMELEISRLPEEDKLLFMEDLGISEPGVALLAQSAYRHLGLISFLTAGEDEVRAWTIPKGMRAKEAAGKIHSDIERGFIKAEVAAFSDLITWGSFAKLKEKGLFRLEGKEYLVEDGDIISFRFNV